MMRSKFTPPVLLVLALAACQQPTDTNIVIDNEVNAAEAANAEIEMLPPSDEAGPPTDSSMNGGSSATEPSTRDSIPLPYRGRWGLVAADCTSTRGDAKGLIVINEGTIRFYESLATLKEQRPAIATSFSGLFDFTGEGQTWTKVMTLTRTGTSLKRADSDGNFTYTRCA